MYVCPVCGKEYEEEKAIVKHFLACWKEKNPSHKSKSAVYSENIETRKMNDDMVDFFNSFS